MYAVNTGLIAFQYANRYKEEVQSQLNLQILW